MPGMDVCQGFRPFYDNSVSVWVVEDGNLDRIIAAMAATFQ